jgi:hypothetical protein
MENIIKQRPKTQAKLDMRISKDLIQPPNNENDVKDSKVDDFTQAFEEFMPHVRLLQKTCSDL